MTSPGFPKPKFVARLPQGDVEIPTRRGNQHYWEIADILRANPGQWARVAFEKDYENTVGTTIRLGGASAFKPAGSFEARRFLRPITKAEQEEHFPGHVKMERVAEIYARYVGEVTE